MKTNKLDAPHPPYSAAICAALVVLGTASAAQDWQPYQLVGTWDIYQHTGAETASCSATHYVDQGLALRLERRRDGYLFNLLALRRATSDQQIPLQYWFDNDRVHGTNALAKFIGDTAYVTIEPLSQIASGGAQSMLAQHTVISFEFETSDNGSAISSYSLQGSGAALRALETCYQQAQTAASGSMPQSDCPGEGPKFAGSGICKGRSINYLEFANFDHPLLPNCEWVVNEAPLPGGDYLLYLAAQCDGRVATLELAGGAHSADLIVAQSAIGAGDAMVVAKVFATNNGTPQAEILARARAEIRDKTETAKCGVSLVVPDQRYAPDVYVVDYTAQYRDELPDDEPYSICGELGFNAGSASFWRVFGGYAWFFDMGQDAWWDFDPASMVVVKAEDLPK